MQVNNISIQKSINAFEKNNLDYLVLLNVKHNALFIYNKDVKFVWNMIDGELALNDLYTKLVEKGFILEIDELYNIVEIMIKSGLLICDSINEDIDYINANNQIDNFKAYCTNKNIATTLHIEITNSCNLKCIHCFHDEKNNHISLDDFIKLFESLKNSQILYVNLTGGEIGTVPYWKEIIKLAKRNGLLVAMISNFTLFDYEDADFIINENIYKIKTSIYSYRPEIHDKITGVVGSFEKTMNILKYLAKNNIKVNVNSLIMKNNINDIEETIKMVKDLNLKTIIDYKIYPSRSNTKDIRPLMIDREDCKHLVEKGILSRQAKNKCGACRHRLRINQNGEIYCCEFLNISLGNIKTDNVIEILNSEKTREIIKKIDEFVPDKCKSCKLDEYCTRCPALVWNEEPYVNKANDLLCYYTEIIN